MASVGECDVFIIQHTHSMGMIKPIQYGFPGTSSPVDNNNCPLMKQRGQDTTIGQFCRRINMGSLLQRTIFYIAMIIPLLQHTFLTSWSQRKTILVSPPFPEDLALRVKLNNGIDPGTGHQKTTFSA